MSAKLLLFDIDGTLLRSHGAGGRAFLRAAELIFGQGVHEAHLMFGGALDPLLFRRLATHVGRELDDVLHGELRARYAALLQEELALAERRCEALPGVHAILSHLRAHRPASMGLLTGNYAETGALKLHAAGIDPSWFPVQAWGDMADARPGLVPVALRQVASPLRMDEVVVIGDTPRDVDCALSNGCQCVAVATGGSGADELRAAGAKIVLDDLSDPSPVLALLA